MNTCRTITVILYGSGRLEMGAKEIDGRNNMMGYDVMIVYTLHGTRNAYILVVKSERDRPLGRSRCRWQDNIKVNLKEIGCDGVDWIEMAEDSCRYRVL
jgi:hypothetical protein